MLFSVMPVTYQIDHSRRLIHTRCIGDVTPKEIAEHFRELEQDPGRPMKIKLANPSMPIIILSPSPSSEACQPADYVVDSLVPNDILEVLANKLGADVSTP